MVRHKHLTEEAIKLCWDTSHMRPALSDDRPEGENKITGTFRVYQTLIGTFIGTLTKEMRPSEDNAMWTD